MRRQLSKVWMDAVYAKIQKKEHIEFATELKMAIQWLIIVLSKNNIPYKLSNLGAGVSLITTKDVDVCPCCKQKLKEAPYDS